MQTQLAPEYQGSADGLAAEAILRKCVHCGFCTATCPTYQLLGDELDGPRGRIYLIKQVLEGHIPTRKTQRHLDHCLTCRSCESTCPSGVQYGHLLDIGRKLVEAKVPRPLGERALRWLLKEGLTSALFAPAMALGQRVRALLPAALKNKVPTAQDAGHWPSGEHARKVLLLAGCVQPAMSPNINRASARVLDAIGIQTLIAPKAGCCGAVKFHMNDQEGGKVEMRANIDAWWPYVEGAADGTAVEAILMNASGCGVTVNSVLPGPTRTEGISTMLSNESKKTGRSVAELEKDFFTNARPTSLIQRLSEPEEIANMVVYACSDGASSTTGAALRVEGGIVTGLG